MAEDVYAVVDLTKKKKNRFAIKNAFNPVALDAAYSMVTAPESPPIYAVVDLSKKRKKRTPKENETALSDTTTASTYDVVERDAVKKRQEKEVAAEAFDATYSTLDVDQTLDNQSITDQSQPDGNKNAPDKKSGATDLKYNRLVCLFVAAAVVTVFAILIVCFSIVFVEIVELKKQGGHSAPFDQQISFVELTDEIRDEITGLKNQSIQQNAFVMQNLEAINQSFAGLKQLNTSISIVENLVDSIQQNVSLLQNYTETKFQNDGLIFLNPVASCAALPPSSPSGHYWLTFNGFVVRVYCDMALSCGNVTGGWTRVAYFNMTDSSQQCPSHGLIPQITLSGEHTCVISNNDAGCSSVTYPTIFPYYKICGKILAHSTGNPDGLGTHLRGDTLTLDSNYVDGVSLTHGHPRQHIWTFAAVNSRNCILGCDPPASLQLVHSEYFCDDVGPALNILWDGNGCSLNNPPWFYRQLPQPITDSIEMRVCRDEGRVNEDIGIEHIEIYVQ